MRKVLILLTIFLSQKSLSQEKADLLVINAKVYTVDKDFSLAESFAIKDGYIVDVGNTKSLQKKYLSRQIVDVHNKYVFPGFIDAHAHFIQYGLTLQEADLVGTKSWEEVLLKLKSFASTHTEGWLIGHGWDQNDWTEKTFPDNEMLSLLFPDRPVLLIRIDGHAVIINKKALELSRIIPGTRVDGGEVEIKNGKLTGILIDNANRLVYSKLPGTSVETLKRAIIDAQENCFREGLTTIDDCGLNVHEILLIDSMQKKGELKMRMYVMLADRKPNYEFLFSTGKIKTDRLNVRAFKVYADGALGSRGACLLQPYNDKPGWTGFLLNTVQHFDSIAVLLKNHGFQMCTHAIGDSGNRTMLNVYARHLHRKNDLRWRIEHAQVINKNDFDLFGEYNIIPSVQPTHATSDMYWAKDRLGQQRLSGAYAYKDLLKQNGWLPLGTDFPVEDISPIKTFYAAVVRKDANGWPPNGYQLQNALSRKEALKGMTIWAAKSNFEENEKGSIEKGKFADFIIVDEDIMSINEKDILRTKILATYVNG